jgi:competence protein ComEC
VLAISLTAVPTINKYVSPVFRPLRFTGNPGRLFLESGRWHRIGRLLRIRSELAIESMEDLLPPAVARLLLFCMRGAAILGHAGAGAVITSLSVQLWLQPLLAFHFNRMSWISPLANIVVVPLSSAVLATGAAAACTTNIPGLGPLLIRSAGFLAAMLLSCTSGIAAIPGAWQRCPTPSVRWVLVCILLPAAWSLLGWKRFWIACAGIVFFFAVLSRGSVPMVGDLFQHAYVSEVGQGQARWRNSRVLVITFLDVGEGDSTVIRFPDGRTWVLDAGGLRQPQSHSDSAYVFDIGEAVVSRYLWHLWVTRIDSILISHPDLDHAGGIAAVMRNFNVGRFGYARTLPDRMISELIEVADDQRLPKKQFHAAMEEQIAGVRLQVLNPPADSLFRTTNENSLTLRLSFGGFTAILTGDLEKAGEAAVLSHPGALDCQLLKVAHHGSRAGTSNSFLDRTRPRWAVLSVGRNNPFGHPSKETFHRLLRHAVRPYSTTDQGAITMVTDGKRYVLESHLCGVLESGEL